MAVYEFGTSIAFRRGDGSTEQFGRSDYRFELIRKEPDLNKKIEIANHMHISKIDKTLRYDNGKIVSSLGFTIPGEVLGLCSYNLGHSKYIRAYISKYITDVKNGRKPLAVIESLKQEVPYLDDGSMFISKGILFDELKEKYWKDISSGVEKRLKTVIRSKGRRCIPLFAIGIFYGDLNPNNQIKIIDQWENSVERNHEDLNNLLRVKDEIFQLYTRTEFIQKCAKDQLWIEHILEITRVLKKIRSYLPSYICPTSYDLNETLSIMNSAEKRLSGKLPTPFKTFWNTWSFFDGLEKQNYRIKLMKDDFEMSDFGSLMKICIGNDSHTSDMASGDYFMAIIYKDDSPYACIKYKIKNRKAELIQFLKKANKWFNPNPDGGTNIDNEYHFLKAWLDDIVSEDVFRIRPHISDEFAISRLNYLRDNMDTKEFRALALSYGLRIDMHGEVVVPERPVPTLFDNLPDRTHQNIKL